MFQRTFTFTVSATVFATVSATVLATVFAAAPLAAQGDRVATVGPGGISKHEYVVYQKRLANELHKSRYELTKAEKQTALDRAVEDELLFQAALALGMHKTDKIMHDRIVRQYEARRTVGRIRPSTFTTAQMMAYYKAHQEEFRVPVQVELQALQFRKGDPTIAEKLRKARRDPGSVRGWRKLGCKKAGQTLSGSLSDRQKQIVYGLRKGQVSDPISGRLGMTFVFRAVDRKASYIEPFAQARAKVKNRMIRSQQKQFSGELRSRVGGGKSATKEQMFAAAIKAKTHRTWNIRKRLINTYVAEQQKRGTPRARLLMQLRRRFRVVAAPPR